MSRFYAEHAEWWPLFSPPAEYVEEARDVMALLDGACAPRTVLELGCGGGHLAHHLQGRYAMTLTDLNEGMLTHSRRLNPRATHALGDMRTLRLGTTFDAVLVHDAVMYMTTESDLRAAMVTAHEHTRPGGVALFLPDTVAETFTPGTDHGGDDDGTRGFRYLEWAFDPVPGDNLVTVDYAFLMRDDAGHTKVVHDRHVEGCFPRATWVRLLTETGFTVQVTHDSFRADVFLATRRA